MLQAKCLPFQQKEAKVNCGKLSHFISSTKNPLSFSSANVIAIKTCQLFSVFYLSIKCSLQS